MPARGSSLVFAAVIAATLGTPAIAAQRAGPGSVTVTEMKGSVMVSWRAVRGTGVSYRVLRGADPSKPGMDLTKPLPSDATSFSDGPPAPGNTVFYTVVAVYGDGSEGASPPVQFTEPGAAPMPTPTLPSRGTAPMPTATVSPRLTTGMGPRMAPPVALRATPVTITGSYIWVTLSWPPVQTTVPEPVSYVVRRTMLDPATAPAGTAVGYVTGIPGLRYNGTITLVDQFADREVPTWYMVVATSTTQGSVSSPWYRRDPPLHHGVDTIIGSYWRVVSGASISWFACVKVSTVPGAVEYVGRWRAGNSNWVQGGGYGPNSPANFSRNVGMFDTGRSAGASLRTALEGGALPQVQMWPLITVNGGSSVQAVADTMHRQTAVVSLTQSPTPLAMATCS